MRFLPNLEQQRADDQATDLIAARLARMVLIMTSEILSGEGMPGLMRKRSVRRRSPVNELGIDSFESSLLVRYSRSALEDHES